MGRAILWFLVLLSPLLTHLCPAVVEGCSYNREAASLGTSTQKPQSAQATRIEKKDWAFTEIQARLHTAHCTQSGTSAYIYDSHDPEGVRHTGLLLDQLWVRGILSKDYRWPVAGSEVVKYLCGIFCAITAQTVLWYERLCNQGAHQSTEPNEEVQCLEREWRHWWKTLFRAVHL